MPEEEVLSKKEAAKAVLHKDESHLGSDPSDEAAKKLLATMETESARRAMTEMRSLGKDYGPLSNDSSHRIAINDGFGWKNIESKDAGDFGADTVAERRSLASKWKKIDDAFADPKKGYDALNNIQKRDARTALEDVLNQSPHFKDELRALSPATRDLIFEEILKNPKFANEFRALMQSGRFEELLEEGRKLRSDILAAESQLQRISVQKKSLKDRNDIAEKRFSTAQKTIDSFASLDPDTKGEELKLKRESIVSSTNERADRTRERKEIQNKITTLEAEVNAENSLPKDSKDNIKIGDLKRQIGEEKTKLRNAEEDILTIDKKLADLDRELKELKAEQDQAKKDLVELQAELDENNTKLHDLNNEELKANAQLEYAQRSKLTQEHELSVQYRDILKHATDAFIEKRSAEVEAAHTKNLEERKEKATSEEEKKLIEQLKKRYMSPNPDKKWKPEYKKDTIDLDWRNLMNGNPNDILDDLLTKAGYDDVTREKLLDNKEFVDKVKGDIASELIAARLKTKGISASEAEAIANTEWGEKAVNEALAKNKKAQDVLDNLLKQNGIDKGIMDYLKENKGKAMLIGGIAIFALILFLLYGGGLGIVAGQAAAGAHVAASNINTGL